MLLVVNILSVTCHLSSFRHRGMESLKSVYNDCYKMVLARTGDISCLKYILVHSPNPEVHQDQSHGLPKAGGWGGVGAGWRLNLSTRDVHIMAQQDRK